MTTYKVRNTVSAPPHAALANEQSALPLRYGKEDVKCALGCPNWTVTRTRTAFNARVIQFPKWELRRRWVMVIRARGDA